jgi:hypothetical protein
MNKQLKSGIRIEAEHKGTIKFIKGYLKKKKTFPSNKIIYTHIASDHIKEHKNYYTKLKKARL